MLSNELSVEDIAKIIKGTDKKYIDKEAKGDREYDLSIWRQFLHEEFSYDDLDNFSEQDDEVYIEFLNELTEKLGDKVKLIECKRTRGSGDYDGYHWIFKIGNRLFKIDGWYSSWEGTNFTNDVYSFYEVEERTKIVKYYVEKVI